MKIRTYTAPEDTKQLLELSKRLTDINLPARIDVDFFSCLQRENLAADLADPAQGEVMLVALDDDDLLIGFLQLRIEKDWVSKRRTGHIARIAVAERAEGTGVAKALMVEADQWAHENNFPLLTLDVFSTNERAIAFYNHLGYEVETMKMVKRVDQSS